MLTEPHGFCLLFHERPAAQAQLYRALLELGFAPWDRSGLPIFVALDARGPKQMWFEAGYLAGARVPMFLIGKGARFRRRHVETIGRLGGWACELDSECDLISQVVRRGLEPTPWDREHRASFLQRRFRRCQLETPLRFVFSIEIMPRPQDVVWVGVQRGIRAAAL